MIDWAEPPLRIHVLLTKADKLNRSESAKVLRETRAILGDRATAQLFSVPDKTGIEAARKLLETWLDDKVFPPGRSRPCRCSNKKPR